jgi:DNA-binding TFAR19-related protein (PDSD5 family)
MRLSDEAWTFTYHRWLDELEQENTSRRAKDEHPQLVHALRQVLRQQATQRLSRIRQGAKHWRR